MQKPLLRNIYKLGHISFCLQLLHSIDDTFKWSLGLETGFKYAKPQGSFTQREILKLAIWKQSFTGLLLHVLTSSFS